jgi:hypothetical protein
MAERDSASVATTAAGDPSREPRKRQKQKLTKPVREAISRSRQLCECIDAFVVERQKLTPGVTADYPKHDLDIMERIALTLENVHKEIVFCEQRLNVIENAELEILQKHAYENDGRGSTSNGQPTLHVHACTDLASLERETGIDTLRQTRASVAFYKAEI